MMATKIMLVFLLPVVAAGISGEVLIVASDVAVKFTCTVPAVLPIWFVNGRVAVTEGDCYTSTLRQAKNRNVTATLIITGNHDTCNTFNVYCRIFRQSQFLYLYNTTLIFQGHLLSPENVHIIQFVNFSTIEWNPPYSTINNDIIHVYPHITQYTVYISDNYTGNSIVVKNVTETRFTFDTFQDGLCPMYQVSAWNAGGEGELSEPVQDSTPQVPQKVAAGSVVMHTTASQVLHIHLHVTEPCERKRPNFYHITVMKSGRLTVNTTVQYDHQSGPQVTIRIELLHNVNMCSLLVSIRAGNSAGLSPPSEIEDECYTTVDSSDSISTTSSNTNATPSAVTKAKQGDDITTIIVISTAVIIVIGGVLIAAATVGIICCRTKGCPGSLNKNKIEMKPNQAYEAVSLPHPSRPAAQVHTNPCPAYENSYL